MTKCVKKVSFSNLDKSEALRLDSRINVNGNGKLQIKYIVFKLMFGVQFDYERLANIYITCFGVI